MFRTAATSLICCAILLVTPLAGAAAGQKRTTLDPQKQVAVIDWVVAVVNDDVITRNELDERLHAVTQQLQKQGTLLPPPEILERQMLERMITDMLQAQFAKESGVRVDDTQLDLALSRIAQQNGFPSLAEFRKRLEADGVNYGKFREEIRSEILTARLREREVESKLVITESEVDNYLANKEKMAGSEHELHLAHILVVIPEQASAERIKAALDKAERALAQLEEGADFAQVAAGYSDANDALKGGDLGWRQGDRLPPLFAEALQMLRPGEITPVLRSPNGFHILKLFDRRTSKAPVVITQTHARHILVKTSEIVSENEARDRLMEIKARLDAGADFAEQARRFSQDGSAQQGGDLDWLSPGQVVREFEEVMNRLRPGEIGVAQTQFGWHLIQVLARRNTDISEQQQRQEARLAIASFKSDEQYQDWLRQLRDRAFIEYRIEETP
jgi:peptidyl-prolyl cis-trans isomerase SurA